VGASFGNRGRRFSDGVESKRIAAATRELLREVRVDADPQARLVTEKSEPGSRGGIEILGQIALALVSGGAVAKLIESLFSFLGRNRRLRIELQNAAGDKLKIDVDFIDRHGIDQAMKIVNGFFTKAA
jgi:hypothetical protein